MVSSKVGAAASVALALVLSYLSVCESFTTTSNFRTPSFVQRIIVEQQQPFGRCYAKKHSEFSVVDEDDDDDDDEDTELDFRQRKRGSGDLLVVNEDAKSRQRSEIEYDGGASSSRSSPLEYAALRPGTVVQVQVGDVSLARKAWKKRRRTGSPLLIPCSILNVDRRSAVRWNLVFLLEKFGQPGKGKRGGIYMSIKDLARTYRAFLKSSLGRQADALGFDSTQDMLQELFNKKIQESYGVFFEEKEEEREYVDEDGKLASSTVTMMYLTAPINRRKAQQRAANPAMLQFRPPRDGDYDQIGEDDVHVDDVDTMTHTGWIRALKEEKSSSEEGDRKLQREYTNFPLSACLRVSQKDDLDTGRVQEGNIFPANVFDFDKIGDGGSPLLTLSLNAASGGRQRLKIKPDRKFNVLKHAPTHHFNDLKVGDGPYRAKVVKLVGRKQKALVDLGVGRELASAGGNTVQVLGTLRYQDSVELDDDKAAADYDNENDDVEDLIVSSLDELDMLDMDDDDEDYDEEDEDIADQLLALRKGGFEPGTFEDGETEEDMSDLYEVNEKGQLVYKDPETGETMVVGDLDEDEEDEEEDEDEAVESSSSGDDDDISDEEMAGLFTENEDGSITYTDPETGETMTINEDDNEYQDTMMLKSLIEDDLNGGTAPSKTAAERTADADEKPKLRSKRLKVGEFIQVYISNVSKQSNQFQVSTNPMVKGQKAKDIKKEAGTKKKLDKLKKTFGGNLDRIYALEGTECEGVVKATSKTGEWVYVQPGLEDLPVGIGALGNKELSGLSAGDNVRVRISGIDEERGQLSMDVISRF